MPVPTRVPPFHISELRLLSGASSSLRRRKP